MKHYGWLSRVLLPIVVSIVSTYIFVTYPAVHTVLGQWLTTPTVSFTVQPLDEDEHLNAQFVRWKETIGLFIQLDDIKILRQLALWRSIQSDYYADVRVQFGDKLFDLSYDQLYQCVQMYPARSGLRVSVP